MSIKKELLPFTFKHFMQLKALHKEAKDRFNKEMENKYKTKDSDLFHNQIHELSEKMYEYINVVSYNKYASNRCRFYNSDDSEEACEGFFKNTFKHYIIHGNCCQSCSNVFTSKIKNIKEESELITAKSTKYFVEDFVIPNNDLD